MAISTTALIPLILMCFLVAGGAIAFAKIAMTPEPSMPSAYYMYSSNYETGTDRDRNTSLVTTPERAHVSPGDVERGMVAGGPSVREIREMAYAGQERRMSVQRSEGSYGNGGYPDRAYDQRAYDQRGYEQRGYEQRGYDQRGYDQRGYDQRGYDQRGIDQRGYDQGGYNGDRPYPGEQAMSPPQRAMYPGERAMSPVAAGNTKEMVYDGSERGMVQTSTPPS